MNESFNFHKAALEQLESTLGLYHHRVGDVCHKLAEHYIDSNEKKMAQ
jgi:hypothetical protein